MFCFLNFRRPNISKYQRMFIWSLIVKHETWRSFFQRRNKKFER
jgi:hypothetical protein